MPHPYDNAILVATPLLAAQYYDSLPATQPFLHQLIAADDGLYLKVDTPALTTCLPIADSRIALPYAPVETYLRLKQPLPHDLLDTVLTRACEQAPDEWAALVVRSPHNAHLRYHEPPVNSQSAGHITYRLDDTDPEDIVIDLHSHGHHAPYFSSTDNRSDQQGGVYLSIVLGDCHRPETVTGCARLVCNGHFLLLNDWKELLCNR